MKKFNVFPLEMFRMQSARLVKLRDYETQKSLGRAAFDLVLNKEGLVTPVEGKVFETPNGMSLRPMGATLFELASNFQGCD